MIFNLGMVATNMKETTTTTTPMAGVPSLDVMHLYPEPRCGLVCSGAGRGYKSGIDTDGTNNYDNSNVDGNNNVGIGIGCKAYVLLAVLDLSTSLALLDFGNIYNLYLLPPLSGRHILTYVTCGGRVRGGEGVDIS